MKVILEKIKTFLKEAEKDFPRRWITDDEAEVYVRVAVHNGKRCLEIGDIQFKEKSPSTPDQILWVKVFLQKVHEINTLEATAVESVMNEEIAGFLLLNAWVVDTVYSGIAALFYKNKTPTRSWVDYRKEVLVR